MKFLKTLPICALVLCLTLPLSARDSRPPRNRPNILFMISDDHSWAHVSAYGESNLARTPAIDQLAREGVLFTGAFSAAPSCAPARASLLTGRNPWQNEEAGVHLSLFPAKFPTWPELLEADGYRVYMNGKVWGPGQWNQGGENVARTRPPGGGRRAAVTNFRKILEQHGEGEPFVFWYGPTDPHRPYDRGARKAAWGDRRVAAEDIPPFLPDVPEMREQLADYAFEVERFDRNVGELLRKLEESGHAENTIVVVTGDNGMPFPRAKRECYEYGIHVPLAIRWPAKAPAGRTVDDLLSFIDLGPTLLDAAGVDIPEPMTGRSLLPILESDRSGLVDEATGRIVLNGKERHNMARPYNATYPVRSIRDHRYLYIRNLYPDRYPVGGPPQYADIGWYNIPPLFKKISSGRGTPPELLEAFEKGTEMRPAEELYDIVEDPGCLVNLAADEAYKVRRERMWAALRKILTEQGDPHMFGKGEMFESAPTIQKNRYNFPGVPPRMEYTPGKMRFDHSDDVPWEY